ncbi:WecB/TagA/CpsF family glycosyltransferase [Robiginitomaculum antarcticum]|uniref:WecB/TagA/CpsF family glycosyltransferase n=1 Tax=Robiginitomaculum antarcticum TaxID=437507 RepID=UPI00036E899F|nr:WecB/TagA/CpsF family glycosyltransferase [Robiginitomaculum antarcticum]
MNTHSEIITPDDPTRRKLRKPERGELSKNTQTYAFLGTQFQPLTADQTLQRASWITAAHSFRYIVTPNVDHIVRLSREPDVFKPLYRAAWLSVCDSRILELLARFAGIPLHAVPGSDLTRGIIEDIADTDTPVTVIAGNEAVAKTVAGKYGLTNMSVHVPPMGLRHKPDAVAACADFIASHAARYHFICVGSPQQEMIAKAALERGDCTGLGLCVGASLDFLAGVQSRAPKGMQNARLEWLYRLYKEPTRMWRRYLVDGPSVFIIYFKWIIKSALQRH